MKPTLLTAAAVRKMIPKRPVDSHKGRNGHVLIVAGSRGMSGAAVLSARGALRSGAGLVTVAIVDGERAAVTHALPEALTLPLAETAEGSLNEAALPLMRAYCEKRRVDVLAIGPGLSVNPGVAGVVLALIKAGDYPVVLDADGLNNVSAEDLNRRRQLIITPHPGELARLLKLDNSILLRDPVRTAQNIAQEHGILCVLKGHPTVISDGAKTSLNPTGNAAMAAGGMGDVLTGAIAGLLAQGLPPWEAACAAVYLHGLAGDLSRVSDRGLLATELADALPRALAKIGVR